jgi:hypothetical protein
MSGKAKIRYVVQCVKHGSESKDWAGKQIVVPAPKSKKDRFGAGCPVCRQESKTD